MYQLIRNLGDITMVTKWIDKNGKTYRRRHLVDMGDYKAAYEDLKGNI